MSDSVGYLLDSHVLLWWWFDPDRLPGPVHSLIVDPVSYTHLTLPTKA